MNDDENKDPNGINKLTVPEMKDKLLTRGLSITVNKPELKAQLVQYLENEEALDNDKINEPDTIVIDGGTADATVINIDATIFQFHTPNATVISGGITGAVVINGGATISS